MLAFSWTPAILLHVKIYVVYMYITPCQALNMGLLSRGLLGQGSAEAGVSPGAGTGVCLDSGLLGQGSAGTEVCWDRGLLGQGSAGTGVSGTGVCWDKGSAGTEVCWGRGF